MRKILIVWLFFTTGLVAGCSSITPASRPLSLDKKLSLEYQRYDKAQQLILARYQDPHLPLDKQTVSRLEWEELLAPKANEAFTSDDLKELATRQAQQIQVARSSAIKASSIDFSEWRALPGEKAQQQIRAFCEAAPKGGMLHIHPWGSLN